jgi:glucose/arabinose dehydrogenase
MATLSRAAMSALFAACGLALTGCFNPATPSAAPPAVTPPAATATRAQLLITRVATATDAPVATMTPQPPAPVATDTALPQPTATVAAAGGPEGKPTLVKWIDGLEKPTDFTHAGDGSGLLYVLEQPGRVRVIRDGQLLDEPFLDIVGRVGSSGNEQGLLGIAFAPEFATTRLFFVNYTDSKGDTIIAGFASDADGLRADSASEWTVLKIDQPFANHNGGQIRFGPDGMLYIGMGDGGSAGDPQNRAQNVTSLLGKMLRIDVSQSTRAAPYAAPADNPSFGADARPEIWSLGLRNPWRFSFDRVTGDLYIGDVGQNAIEEVNLQAAGRGGDNYGWKLREGTREYDGARADHFVEPIDEYEHGDDGCSITGGMVYRGVALPSLAGAYVFGDYCSGKIWSLKRVDGDWRRELLFDTSYSLTSFGDDAAGELVVLDRSGAVYRMTRSANE